MTRFPALVCVALLALVGAPSAAAATPGLKSFRTYASPADGASRSYTIRTPAGYDGTSQVPAVLFLHGRGGGAFSFEAQPYLDAADANGTVLIFWQGRPDPNGLLSTYYVDAANGIPDETDILACLDDALSHFAIDPARVHLVGFSQGGKGALLVGLKNPDRFASVTSGAGPSDAFEGQKWSPSFPDFRDAAGGDPGAGGAVLARWYAQSARFFLRAARNLPVALAHGTQDDVVPDATALFPYRNTHHIADTPGFSDERGVTPTLSQLHAADPAGYLTETRYVAGVGHDELGVLAPAPLFAFFAGKTAARRPDRVAGVAYDGKERRLYWLSLARTAPADGRPAPLAATLETVANRVSVDGASAGEAPPLVSLDLARAGLDPSSRIEIRMSGALALRIVGVQANARLTRDGVPVTGATRDGDVLAVALADYGAGATLELEPLVADVLENDLLVPALVESSGLNGARFSAEISLANLGATPSTLDALLLDGSARATTIALPARSVRALDSATLFASLGAAPGVAPLRLRVVSGDPRRVVATSRVFNTTAAGTFGLSLPVETAGASVLGPGGDALFFGGSPARPERVNVSVFAPFEDASGTVSVVDADGVPLRSQPFALARLARVQLGDLLAGTGPGTTARVHVSGGRVQTYATVVSSSPTNDPFRSPGLTTSAASSMWTVPAVAAASGRAGALFTSDVYLSAPIGGIGPEMTLTFRPHGGGVYTFPLALESGETRLVSDVLDSLFPARVPDYGSLTVTATAPLSVFAVTRADAPAGASSQDVPCVAGGSEVTSDAPAALVGLAETLRFRTNVTLVNTGPATVLTLTLVAEDGERGTVPVSLAPGEFRQLDSVVTLFQGGAAQSAALLVTPAAGGHVVVSGARIDNGTNDPTGLAPIQIPAQ